MSPHEGRRLAWIALTLLAGAAGGFGASILHLPLAFMIGAMAVTTLLAVSGLPVAMSGTLRGAMTSILGVLLGSGFSPDILGRLDEWAISLALLAPYLYGVAFLLAFLVRRFAGYDRVTAYYATMPGGLNEMVTIGGAMGADERVVALAHAVRVLLVVLAIPFWFRFTEGYVSPPLVGTDVPWPDWSDIGLLGGCAVLGIPLGRMLRLPASTLVGPLLLSAAIHLGGLTSSSPPGPLIAAAQIVIGCGVGTRFAGAEPRMIGRAVANGLWLTATMLALTIGAAELVHLLTGLPFFVLVLAYAPGGLAEMSLMPSTSRPTRPWWRHITWPASPS